MTANGSKNIDEVLFFGQRRFYAELYEPLAKLRLHAEFFILRGNKSRLPRPRRAWCFRNESPAESGRGHASTRDAIKHLGSRSMVSFPDATGRDRAAHGTTPAAGGRA